MIPPLQLAAYGSSVCLALCAAGLPRLRFYALARLGLDLARLALLEVPGTAPILYALDALLLTAGPVLMARAARLPWEPLAGLSAAVTGLALSEVRSGRNEALASLYGAALLSAHLFALVCAVSRRWRRNADLSALVLLALAGSGAAGAVVALAWPDQWQAVNAGNVLARLVLCGVCVLSNRRED